MARYRIVRAVACTSAALLCAAVAVSLNKGSMPSSLLSQGEAAAVLEHVLQTHDEAAAHHAGAVLEAVVDSMELPGDGPLEEKYPSEIEQDEQRVASAVRALDEEEKGTERIRDEDEGVDQETLPFSADWLQDTEPVDMRREQFPVTWYVA
eukprot:CAMPEP_0179436128 /NCGR_PEP_ID=MMETSP0799-20121207/20133_1 /TAXON_ID=46947 /ORGANISM="Geminigera cryophila, Strain CCMP2564" /LENGTH=150 /DNA_ID=CAMNT_0021215979 /DNA_START=139 /DNA_END=591 /DNA_ORIENTATION=-